jgi:adenosylhomocysteine nucleosidase
METIGLVVAMSQEIQPLRPYTEGWKRTAFGTFRGFEFKLSGRNCLLVHSGIGLARATQASQALLREASPRLLISVGVGGGVEDDLHVGDVVLGRESCALVGSNLVDFHPLVGLTGSTLEVLAQALHPYATRLVLGTIITTPGSQSLPPGIQVLHPVLDMETSAVARVAAEAGVPLLALRALSDTPQEPIPFDLEAFTSGRWVTRVRRILGTLLRHPGILPRMLQLGRNTDRAARHAALALVTVLSQLAFDESDQN